MRVVLDANVLISAMLSRAGAPARILTAWIDGQFELIVSPQLVAELERALGYPKLRRRIPADDGERFVAWLTATAVMAADPDHPPLVRSRDPDDDYLIALAADQRAHLVSGDDHLLGLTGDLPINSPSGFLALLRSVGSNG
jgi:putative PIN family toxin of toxin-antitoxin system